MISPAEVSASVELSNNIGEFLKIATPIAIAVIGLAVYISSKFAQISGSQELAAVAQKTAQTAVEKSMEQMKESSKTGMDSMKEYFKLQMDLISSRHNGHDKKFDEISARLNEMENRHLKLAASRAKARAKPAPSGRQRTKATQ